MAIDNSAFPERKVKTQTVVPINSRAWQMGTRWNLELECGHVVGFKKSDNIPASVKCLLCHNGESNG